MLKSQMRWSGERQEVASGHTENRRAGSSYGQERQILSNLEREDSNKPQKRPARQTIEYSVTAVINGRNSSRRVQYEPGSTGSPYCTGWTLVGNAELGLQALARRSLGGRRSVSGRWAVGAAERALTGAPCLPPQPGAGAGEGGVTMW